MDGEGLTLICKEAGDWTGKLYALAQGGGKDGEAHAGRSVTVLVDGPYGTLCLCSPARSTLTSRGGGPGNTVVTSFSGVLLVTGGSGLTYGLSLVESLLQKGAQGASAVLVVELTWIVPHPCKHDLYP